LVATPYSARDSKRNVDLTPEAPHPFQIERPPLGAGADVVEDQLVGAFVAITHRLFQDVAGIAVIAELHALHHPAILHVEAGNDSTRRHGQAPPRAEIGYPTKPCRRSRHRSAGASNRRSSRLRPMPGW